MAKFRILQKIKLDWIGEDWKDCYVNLAVPSYKDVKELMRLDKEGEKEKVATQSLDLMREMFIDGKAVDVNKKVIDITKDDIDELPITIIVKCISELVGTINPNS